MTGGYILGWPVMAVLCGIRPKTANPKINLLLCVVLAVAGLMVVEFTGALQWSFLANDMSLKAILVYSFVAFIPKDIVITILAVFIGKRIQKSLSRYLA